MLKDIKAKRKKREEFTVMLTDEDALDITLFINGGVSGFVINLRCRFNDIWHAVYRVDTCHKYLHEQRFWIAPEPITLPLWEESLEGVFVFYLNQIKQSFWRYRQYYLEKLNWC